MVKSQLETKKIRRTPTQIIDSRKNTKLQSLALDPTYANKPVRTVVFVEVHNMATPQVQLMVQKINEIYKDARGGIHYIVPVREGKLGSDLLFEQEFLDIVNKMCEITPDGVIALKDGAKEVVIIRENV